MKVLVTGGAGFIGSAVIRLLVASNVEVLNFDCLTYAGNVQSLSSIVGSPLYSFVHGNICDPIALNDAFNSYRPDMIMHLAAESHVDRSIDGPAAFIKTNILGTYTLLEAARDYWLDLIGEQKSHFRFQHISTDEVYGDLGMSGSPFLETTAYNPSSPYSASKASSDHLVRSWNRTFGLPVLITNCSNNYGPFQYPEKLIPLMILNALKGHPLPIYGEGRQIRDWLYVDDHARALVKVMLNGKVGETYNIGADNEKENIDVVHAICDLLEEMAPKKPADLKRYRDLIKFVPDRPGHDVRYSIDASKIKNELGWAATESFETGLRKTIEWFLMNEEWVQHATSGAHLNSIKGDQVF